MKSIFQFSFIFISPLLICCSSYKVDDFTADELKWYKPFDHSDTVIFISERNDRDTIVFHQRVENSDSTNSYKQGYSKTNYLTVPYEFTKGSYHQFAIMGDGKTRYDQDILNMAKSSAGYSSIEIVFIGTIFSDGTLHNIQEIDSSTYFFNSNKGDYSGMNVEKGIKDFTFNCDVGVIRYTDNRGIKWTRK